MGIVLWHVTMSLDGFIAGPDDSMDWAFRAGPLRSDVAGSVIASTGAILAGRRWFDLARRDGDAARPYGGQWHGPVFVLTHRPLDADTTDLHVLSGDIGRAVQVARDAAGDGNVVIFGADVARQCLDARVVDELLVHVVPALLGEGVRLVDRLGSPVDLSTLSAELDGQIATIRYRVGRP